MTRAAILETCPPGEGVRLQRRFPQGQPACHSPGRQRQSGATLPLNGRLRVVRHLRAARRTQAASLPFTRERNARRTNDDVVLRRSHARSLNEQGLISI